MPAANSVGSVTSSALPKWQLALAVGAPVALGLGYMYYKNNKKPCSEPERGKSKYGSRENGTTNKNDKQISIDGDCNSKTENTPEIETPLEKAKKFKDEGNVHFKMGKFDEAITLYNNAIHACPQDNKIELAIYYQNRAAAYEHLKKYSAVTADCTKALELNPKYVKAFLRRAKALEYTNDLEHALEDVTTACFLQRFTNQSALTIADRVLKKLGKQRAQEHWANKKLIMPSKHFIKKYLTSFHSGVTEVINILSCSTERPGCMKITKALEDQDYDNIISLCTDEIENIRLQDLPLRLEIILLRATFYLLLGKHEAALEDFNTIIDEPGNSTNTEIRINAFIQRASLHMQLDDPKKSFDDFESAVNYSPDCSDIYHHRGQINLLMDKMDEAKEDFQKAVDLNPDFALANVQKCYTDYRYAINKRDVQMVEVCLENFKKIIDKFPDCPECYTLYAEVLSETLDYASADKYFAKAIEKDPYNATTFVHRGLMQLQWSNDINKAVEYIKEALKIDDKCKFGYETLATIEVQRGNLEEAIKLFDKAIELGRTSMELTHIFSLRDGAKAQIAIRDKLGIDPDFQHFLNMS
ncbi:PREDICTED: mitochondrial import receptor subunit TOM70 [Polistes dominula]|uniref:Mitochondrial import receptor subunit TOM70 n=1 Tax=Polistes dominula TaxID=743375 RepID=A0ABM1J4L5_POLDO|nr:PREDICTED: mitochondrial import receptor subunit TOM70 [Polistes dominula]